MTELLLRLRDTRLLRYFLASAGALAVDMGCFLTLLAVGFWSPAASATGYSLGIVAHWLLSSRAVFTDRVAEKGRERAKQKAQFAASALFGLALTTSIVAAGELLGIEPPLAKLASIGVSFILIWLLRSQVVFGRM